MCYIASIQREDTIVFFGKGDTPEEAFQDFMRQAFKEHCDSYEIADGAEVDVFVHKAIFQDDPEWTDEYDPSWQWVLGENIDSIKTKYFKTL